MKTKISHIADAFIDEIQTAANMALNESPALIKHRKKNAYWIKQADGTKICPVLIERVEMLAKEGFLQIEFSPPWGGCVKLWNSNEVLTGYIKRLKQNKKHL